MYNNKTTINSRVEGIITELWFPKKLLASLNFKDSISFFFLLTQSKFPKIKNEKSLDLVKKN